jgi:hypothetical protein
MLNRIEYPRGAALTVSRDIGYLYRIIQAKAIRKTTLILEMETLPLASWPYRA